LDSEFRKWGMRSTSNTLEEIEASVQLQPRVAAGLVPGDVLINDPRMEKEKNTD